MKNGSKINMHYLFVMKKNTSSTQRMAAAMIGPISHSIIPWLGGAILLTPESLSMIFFGFIRWGTSPGGALRISNDNGSENGLDVNRF